MQVKGEWSMELIQAVKLMDIYVFFEISMLLLRYRCSIRGFGCKNVLFNFQLRRTDCGLTIDKILKGVFCPSRLTIEVEELIERL